jgi:hypothetical protein
LEALKPKTEAVLPYDPYEPLKEFCNKAAPSLQADNQRLSKPGTNCESSCSAEATLLDSAPNDHSAEARKNMQKTEKRKIGQFENLDFPSFSLLFSVGPCAPGSC